MSFLSKMYAKVHAAELRERKRRLRRRLNKKDRFDVKYFDGHTYINKPIYARTFVGAAIIAQRDRLSGDSIWSITKTP